MCPPLSLLLACFAAAPLSAGHSQICWAFLSCLRVMQLAGQSVEAFMAKRNYHAMPAHEDVWEVPLSDLPAAYNLHMRMQAVAEKNQQEPEAADLPDDSVRDHPGPGKDAQPRKPKQPVSHVTCLGLYQCRVCTEYCTFMMIITSVCCLTGVAIVMCHCCCQGNWCCKY